DRPVVSEDLELPRDDRLVGDIASVGRDRPGVAVTDELASGRVLADALRRTGLSVADEDVPRPVAVAADEVGRVRREGHVAALAADEWLERPAVALHLVRVHGDQLGRPVLAVTQEDIALAV